MRKFLKNYLPLFLIAVLCLPLTACGGGKLAKLSKSLNNYVLNIDYDNATKSMDITQTLSYVNNSDAILDKIYFHLYVTAFKAGAMNKPVSTTNENKAYYNGKNYADLNINSVKVGNQTADIGYQGNDNNILIVQLGKKLMPTQRVSINFDYYVKIPNIKHRFGYGDNTINVANFYPIACVYENAAFCTEPYHYNGDPFYSDMANYDVTINYDSLLTLASTGEQSTATKSNLKSTRCKVKCVRDFAFVLSEKFSVATTRYKRTTINYYYFDDDNFANNLDCAVKALKTFSNLFMDYPYSTFSVVKTDFLHGGMEYPTLIYISADITHKDDYYNVIIHETAHQWWYNIVGNNQFKYPWLDESLTEFSTLLFYDYNKGYEFTRKGMIDATYENYLFFLSIYKDVMGKVDTTMSRALNEYDTEPEYTYMAYVKGVLMYDSLYQIIGKTKFIGALQQYAKQYAYKNAVPSDLIDCFEKSSGARLESFFSAWTEGRVIIN